MIDTNENINDINKILDDISSDFDYNNIDVVAETVTNSQDGVETLLAYIERNDDEYSDLKSEEEQIISDYENKIKETIELEKELNSSRIEHVRNYNKYNHEINGYNEDNDKSKIVELRKIESELKTINRKEQLLNGNLSRRMIAKKAELEDKKKELLKNKEEYKQLRTLEHQKYNEDINKIKEIQNRRRNFIEEISNTKKEYDQKILVSDKAYSNYMYLLAGIVKKYQSEKDQIDSEFSEIENRFKEAIESKEISYIASLGDEYTEKNNNRIKFYNNYNLLLQQFDSYEMDIENLLSEYGKIDTDENINSNSSFEEPIVAKEENVIEENPVATAEESVVENTSAEEPVIEEKTEQPEENLVPIEEPVVESNPTEEVVEEPNEEITEESNIEEKNEEKIEESQVDKKQKKSKKEKKHKSFLERLGLVSNKEEKNEEEIEESKEEAVEEPVIDEKAAEPIENAEQEIEKIEPSMIEKLNAPNTNNEVETSNETTEEDELEEPFAIEHSSLDNLEELNTQENLESSEEKEDKIEEPFVIEHSSLDNSEESKEEIVEEPVIDEKAAEPIENTEQEIEKIEPSMIEKLNAFVPNTNDEVETSNETTEEDEMKEPFVIEHSSLDNSEELNTQENLESSEEKEDELEEPFIVEHSSLNTELPVENNKANEEINDLDIKWTDDETKNNEWVEEPAVEENKNSFLDLFKTTEETNTIKNITPANENLFNKLRIRIAKFIYDEEGYNSWLDKNNLQGRTK